MSAQEEIERLTQSLNLQLHPSGFGHFTENFRGDRKITFVNSTSHQEPRDSSTSVYFILEGKNIITWHILLSDEFFYWHAGGVLKLHLIDKSGNYSSHLLGDTLKRQECAYFLVIPHDTWYAAELIDDHPYVLYSAVVAPGWELRDWTEGKKSEMIKKFPKHLEILERLCGQ